MNKDRNKKLEKLTIAIQKHLNNNPALLIGSGASIPYGLPSMENLADEIKSKLQGKYRDDDQWKNLIKKLNETNNLEITLDNVDIKDAIQEDIIWVVLELIERKDKVALTKFISENFYPALTDIIEKSVQKTGPTNIVTTNYDRLIEYAIDFADGKNNTGFSGNYIQKFTQFSNNFIKRAVNLYKVHGSIDWFKHKENQNILSLKSFNKSELSDKYIPLIITPGNGKYRETHVDPFRTIISKADVALRNSASYLCIGYGFNDEHIQPIIIDENRNNKKPIVIVTKEVTPKIKELFLKNITGNCLIISEGGGNGCKVYYSSSETELFSESYWQLDEFYKLWF
ncbi:MAG: SIR2 family protein [Candidatus Aminicenantes bacterium]|nr:SIR2 family protein [Candidatus Aminicenantes bacterium]